MFEEHTPDEPAPDPAAGPGDAASPHDTVDDTVLMIRGWLAKLAVLDRGVSDAERVDQIRALEELKAAAAAAQPRASVDLDTSQRRARAAAGVRAGDQGRGIAAQVALARRESPHRGASHLGLAKILHTEMPHTLAALTAGRVSEWRATLLARETACLSLQHRTLIDRVLAADRLAELETWGDRRLVAEARRLAYRLDPHAALERVRRAETDRRVTSRPAPDTMAYLTALLPAAQAVACYATLSRAADTARAAGDPRTRGQVMADTLVQLLTGQATPTATPLTLDLVITDQTLFAGLLHHHGPDDRDDTDSEEHARHGHRGDLPGPLGDPRQEPAHLHGYGPVPAGWTRDLIAALPDQTQAWIRRLYTHPTTGQLLAMDSHRRTFPHGLRTYTVLRDQHCRTPWCDAPIRHRDHPQPHAEGGPTSALNAQGLCEACNYTKQAPGWTARPLPGLRHTVRTTTPTGHSYHSTAPPQPGHQATPPDPGPDWIVPEIGPDPLPPDDYAALTAHLNAIDEPPPIDDAA